MSQMEEPVRITIDYDDRTVIIDGVDARRWHNNMKELIFKSFIAGVKNPFDENQVVMRVVKKGGG